MVVAVIALAVNLRSGASSPGPILEQVRAAFGVGETAAGALTAVPGLCFGALGMLAVPLARRLGLTGTILLGFALSAAGLLLRPWAPSFWLFLILTAAVLSGPAVGNVLVPAWVKRHGGKRTVLLMTGYTVMLALGGAAGSALAVPLMGSGPDGWRTSLAVWGLLAVIPLLPLAPRPAPHRP